MPRVRRERLNGQIAAAARARITLLVAGAGFGKTIALDEYVHAAHPQAVWFTMGREHRSLRDFARGFAEALAELLPDMLATLPDVQRQLFASVQPAADLAAWLSEYLILIDELAIVVDGLQHAEPDAVEALVLAVERAANVRWFLSTRTESGLPTASWLGYGHAEMPLVEDDLRFTREETRAAAYSAGVDLRDDELDTLHTVTGGWPIALSIALRRRIRPADLGELQFATRAMMYRYIAEQIFGALDAEQRAFVLATTPLRGFDLGLAAVHGHDAAFLAALARTLTFVHRIAPDSYRYDDLFQDFLEHELLALPADERQRIMRAGADIAEQRGFARRAVFLATQIGDQERIASLLTRFGIELLSRGNIDVVVRALDAVAPNRRLTEPAWLGLRALIDAAEGEHEQADARFREAIRLAAEPELRDALLMRHSIELVRRNVDCAALLEPAAHDMAIPVERRIPLLATLATSYAQRERNAEARAAMTGALQYVDALPQEAAARVYMQAAYVYQFDRDSERARRYSQLALDLARTCGQFDIAARALSVLYFIAMEQQHDPATARELLEEILMLARRGAGRQAAAYASIALAILDAEAGDAAAFDAAEVAIADTADIVRVAYDDGMLRAIALRAAWDGEFARAHHVLRESPEQLSGVDRRALRWAELALYARAASLPDDAMSLRNALAELERAPGTPIALRARAVVALTELIGGHTDAAHRLLGECERSGGSPFGKALVGAVRAAYRQVTDTGSPEQTEAALVRLEALGYGGFAKLMRRLEISGKGGAYTRLTATEREVLALLVEGASTKDLAARTGRSPMTVDTHVRSICRKLECSGRREAVALAVRHGWLVS